LHNELFDASIEIAFVDNRSAKALADCERTQIPGIKRATLVPKVLFFQRKACMLVFRHQALSPGNTSDAQKTVGLKRKMQLKQLAERLCGLQRFAGKSRASVQPGYYEIFVGDFVKETQGRIPVFLLRNVPTLSTGPSPHPQLADQLMFHKPPPVFLNVNDQYTSATHSGDLIGLEATTMPNENRKPILS
jgi:hypothetical protein